MTACPLCNKELGSEYLDSIMDELAHNKDTFYSKDDKCPHCQQKLLFEKNALSYYLINDDKEILICGA